MTLNRSEYRQLCFICWKPYHPSYSASAYRDVDQVITEAVTNKWSFKNGYLTCPNHNITKESKVSNLSDSELAGIRLSAFDRAVQRKTDIDDVLSEAKKIEDYLVNGTVPEEDESSASDF